MRRGTPRSWLVAIASLTVAGTISLAATAAAGFEPGQPSPLPDAVFRPVVVPSTEPGLLAAPERKLAASNAAPDVPENLAPNLAEIRDPWLAAATAPPERARPSVPVAQPLVVAVPTAPPKTSHSLSGPASWYCEAGQSPCTVGYPDDGGMDAYAAAGPKLRAALGSNWRGRIVYVDGIRVKLIDWCQCYKGESNEKLLDLYYDVFARTGSRVTIRW